MEIDPQETTGRAQSERAEEPRRIQEPQRRNARYQAEEESGGRRTVITRRKPHELPPPIKAIVGQERFNVDTIMNSE
ncbi:MAG: hypothetical protein M1840_008124, partial [Geoglossum simile]